MDLTAAFKQTDIGPLPSDWDVVPLGELVTRVEYGSSAKSRPKGRVPVLRMGNLQHGKIDWGDLVYTDNEEEIERYTLHDGEVLFNRTNTVDLVGKTAIYEGRRKAIFAGYLIRVVAHADRLDARYLNYVMNTEVARKHSAKVLSVAVGQANINGQKLRTYPIPVPPTLAEQEAIARALGDVDALLERLDQLIAKKRDLRIAVMQQLLSGETRLPGHMKPWTEARLGELGTFFKGSGVRKSEANSGALPCVRYGELYTHHDNVVRRFFSSISPQVAATATRLERGDLLFAGSGETKEEIGKCAAFAGDFLAYAGGDIVVLRNHRQNPTFMGYYCNSPVVGRQKASKGQGDAVVHISARALADISVRLPSVPEQDAIAEVLEDSDAEISTLEERRAKTQDLKLAMMQELLTGKTQLHTTGGSNG